jgi:diguanylate cyclase (GGDEF)-like protein
MSALAPGEGRATEPATPLGRVLVVEHDAAVARLLDVLLKREGYDVQSVDTAAAALDIAERGETDVVLIDRSLPDSGGLELLDRLRALRLPMESIVMTVDPAVEFNVQAGERGAFDVVVKPFSHLRLISHQIRRATASALASRQRDDLRRKLTEHASVIDLLNAELNRRKRASAPSEPQSAAHPATGSDPLTGVLSTAAIEDRFRNETARALRYGRPLGLALLRIDGFESLLEQQGRPAGDAALRAVAVRALGGIREVDSCGRLANDDFLLLLPETAKAASQIVAERLRMRVAESPVQAPSGRGPIDLRITISVGLAALPADTMNAQALLKRAESSLARARTDGPNRVYVS